jgi:hypothetical protein
MNVTCLTHLIPLDLIILIMIGEKYKLSSSSLFDFNVNVPHCENLYVMKHL